MRYLINWHAAEVWGYGKGTTTFRITEYQGTQYALWSTDIVEAPFPEDWTRIGVFQSLADAMRHAEEDGYGN